MAEMMAKKMKMEGHTKATWSDAPAMPQEKGGSATVHMAAGTGSRPVPSKYKIETSAPEDAHTQGRDVPGSLK